MKICCPGCGSDMEYLSEVSVEQLERVSSAFEGQGEKGVRQILAPGRKKTKTGSI